jgi:hypothetical protein
MPTKNLVLKEKNMQEIIPITRGKPKGYAFDSYNRRDGNESLNKVKVEPLKSPSKPPPDCPLNEKGYCSSGRYLPCPNCELKSKILIIFKKKMPQATPELAEILGEEGNKVRQICYKLKKEGWVTSRKLSSGKALNFFPMTGEVATRWNRVRIYKIIYDLHILIKKYIKSFKAIKYYFDTLQNTKWLSEKQRQRIIVFRKKLEKTLKASGIDDALYMVGLIPFPPKTLYWNLSIYTSEEELDEYLQAA